MPKIQSVETNLIIVKDIKKPFIELQVCFHDLSRPFTGPKGYSYLTVQRKMPLSYPRIYQS